MFNLEYMAGILVGIAVGLLLCVAIFFFVRGKSGSLVSKYDERQRMAQGRSYRNAYWTLFFYLTAWFILSVSGVPLPETRWMILLALFLAITVYIVGCIFMDAYIGLNDNRKRITTGLIVAGLLNIVNVFTGIGVESSLWPVNLACVVMILIVLASLYIKTWMDRQITTEEEGE